MLLNSLIINNYFLSRPFSFDYFCWNFPENSFILYHVENHACSFINSLIGIDFFLELLLYACVKMLKELVIVIAVLVLMHPLKQNEVRLREWDKEVVLNSIYRSPLNFLLWLV